MHSINSSTKFRNLWQIGSDTFRRNLDLNVICKAVLTTPKISHNIL